MNRTARSIALTEMGSAYFKFSVRFLRELENEEHFIKRLQRESEGALKISAPKSFGSFLFADAVAEFASLHPDINVSLTLDDSSSLQTKSIEYEFDVAIRLMAIEDSTAVARKIGGIDWIACASADYILRHGAPQHPQDLTKANCLVHPKLASDNLWRFVSGNRIVAVKVGGTFASNSVVVLRRAALRGLGIALLPLYRVQRDLASGLWVPAAGASTLPIGFLTREIRTPQPIRPLDQGEKDEGLADAQLGLADNETTGKFVCLSSSLSLRQKYCPGIRPCRARASP